MEFLKRNVPKFIEEPLKCYNLPMLKYVLIKFAPIDAVLWLWLLRHRFDIWFVMDGLTYTYVWKSFEWREMISKKQANDDLACISLILTQTIDASLVRFKPLLLSFLFFYIIPISNHPENHKRESTPLFQHFM